MCVNSKEMITIYIFPLLQGLDVFSVTPAQIFFPKRQFKLGIAVIVNYTHVLGCIGNDSSSYPCQNTTWHCTGKLAKKMAF